MSETDDARRVDRLEQSGRMLRQMVDGSTYDEVAVRFGITKTAVERRVKTLARRLLREVGVAGLDEVGIAFASRLRLRRDALLAALDRFEVSPVRMAPATVPVSDADLEHAAALVRGRSRMRARDLALFYVLYATGARPLEIARLRVADYLTPGGEVRRVSELPAHASLGGRPRPLYFASRRLNDALGEYLTERRLSGQGVGETGRYRGLDPSSRLFLSANGQPFAITTYGDPGQHRFLCRAIQEIYRKIFRYAGLPGASSLTVRRTLADRMYARGADESQVGLVLGISKMRTVRESFPRPRPPLEHILEDLV